MHRPIFGHSFAVLVAPILLSVLAFKFLNKNKANGNAENSDTRASDSLTAPTETNSSVSNFTLIETTNDESSSSTEWSGNSYDVFLSFSGKDTRAGFTDHLYHGLVDAGIPTFRDDNELRLGKKIGSDLFAAIKNSKILIPILSVNYGTSSWCLDELVRIMECNKKMRHIVLPIFYKVEPSDVRHQKGHFGEEFRKRASRLSERVGFDPAILKEWEQALKDVSSLKGWNVTRPEGELVKLVVQKVLEEVIKRFELDIPENLIGIDSHVEKVMKFVNNKSHASLFVGIYGMGGIGKTTIAKTIYNRLSNQFEYRSFVADIRETYKNGVVQLQNQLISDLMQKKNKVCNKDAGIKILSSNFRYKKVLILLDDVGVEDHLNDLARSKKWFSPGSVIIITTRDESILDGAEVDLKHQHDELSMDNSLILFCRHTFRNDNPLSEFEKLANEVVSTTGGLPLSLKVIGSFLRNKERRVWEDTIKQLRNVPNKEVQDKLRISYDALEVEEKQIFLDIACFFIGSDWRIASYMWDGCGFFPHKGLAILRLRSLIKVGENHELIMHDQLRDLGQAIVHQEDEEPQNRSRLWKSEEVLKMLEEDEGTKKIQAINLSKGNSEGFGKTIDQGGNILKGKQFKKLRNLRFLDARGAHFSGDFQDSMKKLKWLHWEYYPSPFEGNNLHVKELRVLKLWGNITDKWQGWRFIMMAKELRYLNLANCPSLKGTSFLSAFKNLEVLILKECEELKQIDSSIGNMKNLVCLDLTGCHGLWHKKLPAEVGKLKALKQLLLGHTGVSLPDSIWALQNLEILDIGCANIKNLPESVGTLQNLIILDINNTKIKKLPHGIGRLISLRDLSAEYCYELEGEIPESIYNLSSLQRLTLSFCKKLPLLSVLPSSLKYLRMTCQNRKLPSLSNLTHLKELVLLDCKFLECIWEHPSTLSEKSVNTPLELELEILEICRCELVKTLDVSQFNHLRKLCVEDCNKVHEIRGLNKLKYLESLEITACAIEMFDLSESKGLRLFEAKNCKNLVEIQGLDKLQYLEGIVIAGCTSIVRLDLRKSKGMKRFNAKNCIRLVEIQGLDRWESLEGIIISGCVSITSLDLRNSKAMRIIDAKNCENLVEIQGLDMLESLKEIDFSGCSSIVRLSLPKSKDLKIFGAKNYENLDKNQALYRLESSKMPDYGAYDSINNMGNYPFCKGWDFRKLYGGLYKSLYEA